MSAYSSDDTIGKRLVLEAVLDWNWKLDLDLEVEEGTRWRYTEVVSGRGWDQRLL